MIHLSSSRSESILSKKSSTWFIYILECKDGTYYTGITNDVEKRFQAHQNQEPQSAKYLRGKNPFILLFSRPIGTKSEALKMEHLVKNLSRIQKETLIKTGLLPT